MCTLQVVGKQLSSFSGEPLTQVNYRHVTISALGFVCSTWQWGWSEYSDKKLRFMALNFVLNRILNLIGLSHLAAPLVKKKLHEKLL